MFEEPDAKPEDDLGTLQNIRKESVLDFLHKNVGPKGSHISGGQKQRVAIARALLRDPQILLLDEATSALDIDTESKVNKCLNNFMEGRTSMNITHRLDSTLTLDTIYVLNYGEIVQKGRYRDLENEQGIFSEMNIRG